ncbi:hypothetical protein DFH07DRAFT_951329 [Mycena maculata]|uniref:Uncharacterized protein n=1 Tax=Mycena maculata TaxID=230809 RepID=A0AAD7K3T3_9AGAR|nr:hypothetical protein DFH07DRAFT_951329 [Mycena maculata]
MAHPGLTALRCHDPTGLELVLDVFEWSPQLRTIGCSLHRQSPDAVAALQRAMRRLSFIPTSICLDIFVGSSVRKGWEPIGDAERQIVGCLYTVSSVKVHAFSVHDIQLRIPWLAMLPCVARLEMSVWPDGPADDRASLIEEARAALPRIPDIVMHSTLI